MNDKIKCSTCRMFFPPEEVRVYKQTNSLTSIQSVCRNCMRERRRKYRSTETGRRVENEASKRAYQKHKVEWLARAKLRYAVKIGIIERPKYCEVCDKIKPLQGHHEDYTKPLEVIWLCRLHHKEQHAKEKLLKIS